MPWTGHHRSAELPFSERTAHVRTNVIDGAKRTVRIKERHGLVAHDDELAFSGPQIADPRGSDESRHSILQLSILP
jgi:hypothetical protein